MIMNKYPPIIILGMHRSGTSMIAGMLEELGLFIGDKKDKHNESLLFLQLNNWLMQQNSCAWDNPRSFAQFLENDNVQRLTLGYLRNILQSKYMDSFLGRKNLFQNNSSFSLNCPWAWKDPRSTFTLPVWLKIFPDARVIHIFRNGIDVANSLKTRHEKILQRSLRKWDEGKFIPRYRLWKALELRGVGDSIRCSSLDGSFSLWEEYIEEARIHIQSMGDRALKICYEDFLIDPISKLQEMVSFCNLTPAEKEIKTIAAKVNKTRANAFLDNPELVSFSKKVAHRLEAQGYRT